MPPKKKKALKLSKLSQLDKGAIDFVLQASADPQLTKDFLAVYYKAGATPQDLEAFFRKRDYDGVSLSDCAKMIDILANAGGKLPCNFDISY